MEIKAHAQITWAQALLCIVVFYGSLFNIQHFMGVQNPRIPPPDAEDESCASARMHGRIACTNCTCLVASNFPIYYHTISHKFLQRERTREQKIIGVVSRCIFHGLDAPPAYWRFTPPPAWRMHFHAMLVG